MKTLANASQPIQVLRHNMIAYCSYSIKSSSGKNEKSEPNPRMCSLLILEPFINSNIVLSWERAKWTNKQRHGHRSATTEPSEWIDITLMAKWLFQPWQYRLHSKFIRRDAQAIVKWLASTNRWNNHLHTSYREDMHILGTSLVLFKCISQTLVQLRWEEEENAEKKLRIVDVSISIVAHTVININ